MYIRFGEIPEDERSGVYHAGELVNKEEGVSVYDAKIDDWGNVSVCLPLPINANTLDTFRNLVEYENRPCYLVNGDYIGKGSDNEPLIRNVSIVGKIKYREKNWEGLTMNDTTRPRCGDCSHLQEKAVSDVCSVLWCDLPNGNRKASRDVGGCDEFEPSAACKAEQLREVGKMSVDDVLKAVGRLGEEIKKHGL